MERTVFARSGMLLLAALVVSCRPSGPDVQPNGESAARWLAPPRLERALTQGDSIVLIGAASPEARIVVSASGGAAHGANADADGRFRLAVPRPPRATLMSVETRSAGLQAREAGRLLLLPDGQAAMLTPGAPSRLLSADDATVVDHDGRLATITGHAAPGSEIAFAVDGRVVARATADAGGRYSAATVALGGGGRLMIDALGVAPREVVLEPPSDPAGQPLEVAVVDGTTTVAWAIPGGGRQRTLIVPPAP